ncbi:probable auxin efflux carrier component 5a [Phragmites australis]|uniref:probable auxin efflux carrier component 5a n=1 Tax=Phragmites australis TaxID=29695 RepID=UPI002D785DDF|nr:probable auxin efflux carrier component 5a [Phragmites australis]
MIGWGDVYKVVAATAPLYFALFLGYGSVRWWRIFTPEQCDAVNRLVAFFALPFFTFEFTLHTDPFQVNYRAVAADVISKMVIVTVIAVWARFMSKGGCAVSWSITSFSLSTLTNSLVVGVPMARAMYGEWAQQLVVQLSVFQAIVWLTLLLFVLEVRKAAIGMYVAADVPDSSSLPDSPVKDVKASADAVSVAVESIVPVAGGKPSLWALVKVVAHKLARNPNTYASFVGITWACVANRLRIELPSAFEGCVLIMSKSGTGMAMFSMGLFMAQQEKVLACGPSLAALGLVLKFALGPAAMAVGSIAAGLRGDVLRVAIIQAALPQSITSFIFAKEYGLHADVLSTAVIFGMLVSLPLLVGFYIVLELIR